MTKQEIDELIQTKLGVMIYFEGTNCSVCSVLKPKIDTMFKENFSKIERIYIKADEEPQLSADFVVFSVPTVLVYLDGKEFMRYSRNISLVQMENDLKRLYEMLEN
ncbi:thioredoxin family protein [Arcobacter sp. FWKO B]|uniref:thioredoxin family protein n=1 Tax=Arcobacter sp. FWKO B TaxID=2593672 RepID=UPI0018A5BADD|nr:thioredoxin family protein [Arcobacter sp. FWKO B]QOG13008.1 thioredoxin family protein [Arcobacter sp. FWKO B]